MNFTRLGRSLAAAAIPAVLMLQSVPAAAQSLIGDTLNFLRAYPTPTTPYWDNPTASLTPAAGTGDAVTWLSGTGFNVLLDGDATTITMQFPTSSSFVGTSSLFDGFIISGFDHDIASASVLLNSSGYAATLSLPTLRSIQMNFNGNGIADGMLVLEVQVVPEPSTWALMAAGLAACAVVRRRAQRVQG